MMLLDILNNLPHLCMSSNQFHIILWLLKETGISNVPSYKSFRKMQNKLYNLCGSVPKPYTSSIGNLFYVNDIRESVGRVCSLPPCSDKHYTDLKHRILQILRFP